MRIACLYITLLISLLYSCQKPTDDPFTTGTSYPGALDSCAMFLHPGSFSSDSGVYAGEQVQTFRFSYDDQRRVVKMAYVNIGINISNVYTTFYYNGQSKNAFLVKDSGSTSLPYVRTHKLFYDNQERVVLDSSAYYSHN